MRRNNHSDLAVLRLKEGATREEVTRAYNALMLVWHPTKYPYKNPALFSDADLLEAANRYFIEIQAAYEKLTQKPSEQQQQYDFATTPMRKWRIIINMKLAQPD